MLQGPKWRSNTVQHLAHFASRDTVNACAWFSVSQNDSERLRSVLTTMGKPAALVLARVPGRPLAAKPDLVSLLRCRWAPGCAFAAGWVARVAAGVAAALAHLHSLGVSTSSNEAYMH